MNVFPTRFGRVFERKAPNAEVIVRPIPLHPSSYSLERALTVQQVTSQKPT